MKKYTPQNAVPAMHLRSFYMFHLCIPHSTLRRPVCFYVPCVYFLLKILYTIPRKEKNCMDQNKIG